VDGGSTSKFSDIGIKFQRGDAKAAGPGASLFQSSLNL
jgi:hypothetical protein